ncbi:L-aspartate oxidase [Peptostreptococcus russellii]|uniref:L-aspartate oxidase n=1 Tax=Peptostreptococcus russellii TaxID=215200 RepID=A0A1H8KQL9_9FIRM|nr:L-aspartate oxidase [Peptostreptococcus russellii]SEN95200.1 L-aspartate oxidase [Peptostreptococcus russellii]
MEAIFNDLNFAGENSGYIYKDKEGTDCIDTDVLVIGSGVAGLNSALNISKDLNVLVISKDKVDCTNTKLAQGGISVARNKEDIPLFIEDTLKAGKYKNDLDAVKVLAEESIDRLNDLIDMGIELDKNSSGEIDYTKEGAHTISRIVHSKDHTGENVEKTLILNALKSKNINIWENSFFIDIIESEGKCVGAIVVKDSKQINIFSKYTILACGGIGGLYNNSTSQRILNGDGIAAAIKHGIELKDINYIQIHPTAFYDKNNNGRRFLISESLRGEGAILKDINGNRFVDELLPRDIVSKAILKQMKDTNSQYVLLDASFMDAEYLKNRFSLIYENCLEKGIDITKEAIPVSPAQHYFMGGIKANTDSKTSMENLFAVGETSCTGIHGANRLASNSLLEGLVFGKRAANFINKNIKNKSILHINVDKINKDIETIKKENKDLVIKTIKEHGGYIDA